MKMRTAAHRARVISSEETASFVSSGMWLDYGTSLCQPDVFDKALAARAAELQNVKIRSCLSMKPHAVLEADLDGEHFFWFSLHFSGYDRRKHDAGCCNYMPLNLGEIPDYYRVSLSRSTSSSSRRPAWMKTAASISAPPISGTGHLALVRLWP
jgi:acyl-CoA hydrolase